MISGLFEVHLITTPECQTKLFGYITNISDKRLIRPRPTCSNTLYGDYKIQPMLTFWLNSTSELITNIVDEIQQDMINNGIPIIRTKIESMAHNSGVPETISNDHYFEFHFKINISGTSDWNNIVKLITPFGAHLFYNPYNKTLNPTVTVRRYTSLQNLEDTFTKIKDLLETNGYELTHLEKEYSVFDSDVNLDKNWLFNDTSQNFITQVNNDMLFAF